MDIKSLMALYPILASALSNAKVQGNPFENVEGQSGNIIDAVQNRGYDEALAADQIDDSVFSYNNGQGNLGPVGAVNASYGIADPTEQTFPTQEAAKYPNTLNNLYDEYISKADEAGEYMPEVATYDALQAQTPALASAMAMVKDNPDVGTQLINPLKKNTNKGLDLLYQQMVEGNVPMDERIIDAVNDGAEFLPDIVKYK